MSDVLDGANQAPVPPKKRADEYTPPGPDDADQGAPGGDGETDNS
jgi:hypothetical protein